MNPLFDLTGQVALVTGGSRGLGQYLGRALAKSGADLIVTARKKEDCAAFVAEIEALGRKCVALDLDVRNKESIDAMAAEAAKAYPQIHILVNNAGCNVRKPALEVTWDDWNLILETNLRGAFLFTRAATRPMMQARSGRIINISSVSGLMGNPGQSNYSASKAGMIGMTRSVARELAGRKVTVNAVAPGFIETEMTGALGDSILDEVKKRIPAKRLGTPQDIAQAVLFLASPAASYITGQVLTVDGGLTA